MKPLKLIMKNLGPYINKTEIDFTALGEKGLYLITGDTGAGKTMIFDAICIALYGSSSTDERSPFMLKSIYADEKTDLYISLDFEHKGKKYTVSREGKKTFDKVEFVDHNLDDSNSKKTINKKTEVNCKIEEILNMNLKQFRQVSMIAQGKFREFLTTSTIERTEFLSKLLKTERYEELQKEIELKYKNLIDKEKNIKNMFFSNAKDFKLSEENNLQNELKNILSNSSENFGDINSIYEICKNASEEEQKIYDECDEQYNKSVKDLTETNKQLSDAKNQQNLIDNLNKYSSQKEKLMPVLKAKESDFEKQKENVTVRENLSAKIAQSSSHREGYEKVNNILKEADKIKLRIEKNKTLSVKAKKEYEEKTKQLDDYKKYYEEIKDCEIRKAQAENNLREIKNSLDNLKSVGKMVEDYNKIIFQCSKQKFEYDKIKMQFDNKENECKNKEKLFNSQQAAMLAEKLEDDKPCPVCGSKVHPNPARKISETINEEAVDELKREVASLDEIKSNEYAKYISLKDSTEEKKKNVEKAVNELFGNCLLENAEACINDESAKLQKKYEDFYADYTKADKQIMQKIDAESKIADTENEIQKLLKKSIDYDKFIGSDTAAYNEKISVASDIKKSLPFETWEEFEDNISKMTEEKNKLTNAYTKAENEFNEVRESIVKIDAQIKTLKAQIEKSKSFDVKELDEKVVNLNHISKNLFDKRDCLKSNVSVNLTAFNKMKNLVDENKEISEELLWFEDIYQLVTGNYAKKDSINLKTYVQFTYFENILAHANVRFLQMSNGQYELVRVDGKSGKGKAKAGLELNVLDHNSDESREVKSISGGESFMAALSLALGFSDEIQQNDSGIQLDSMFIDEGFGSLSEDVLNRALNTLDNLAEGNRIVGIISHVPELKERILKQIIVRKDKANGSTVEISV